MLSTLRQAEREMNERGEFSPETEKYMNLFGWRAPHADDPRKLGRSQEETLRRIRDQIQNFERMDQDSDKTDAGAESDCYAIPDSAALNRILKYPALNDCRLQRALTQVRAAAAPAARRLCTPPVRVSLDRTQ